MKRITTKRLFNKLMMGVKEGTVRFTQKDQVVEFVDGKDKYEVDYINYYNFFDAKKHGEDRIKWG